MISFEKNTKYNFVKVLMTYSRTKFNKFWGIFGDDKNSARKVSLLFSNALKLRLEVISTEIANKNVEPIFFELDKLKGTLNYLGFRIEATLVERFEDSMLKPYCWVKLKSDYFTLEKQLNYLNVGIEQEINDKASMRS